MTMTDKTLPARFKELEPWLDWALPTETERYAKRIGTPLEGVKAFHSALHPHMEDAMRYLSSFEWGTKLDLPDENLFLLGLAFMEASVPVDLGWKQSENEGAYPYKLCTVPYRR